MKLKHWFEWTETFDYKLEYVNVTNFDISIQPASANRNSCNNLRGLAMAS